VRAVDRGRRGRRPRLFYRLWLWDLLDRGREDRVRSEGGRRYWSFRWTLRRKALFNYHWSSFLSEKLDFLHRSSLLLLTTLW
jgi:hypothetical protein